MISVQIYIHVYMSCAAVCKYLVLREYMCLIIPWRSGSTETYIVHACTYMCGKCGIPLVTDAERCRIYETRKYGTATSVHGCDCSNLYRSCQICQNCISICNPTSKQNIAAATDAHSVYRAAVIVSYGVIPPKVLATTPRGTAPALVYRWSIFKIHC